MRARVDRPRRKYIYTLYTTEGSLRATEIAREFTVRARLFVRCESARERAPLLVCTRIYALRPARTKAFYPHPRPIHAPTVDDASSRTSRSESFLSLAHPSLHRLVPLRLLFVLLPLALSFVLAALTNAGYNSIVGHDPQGALTPGVDVGYLRLLA